MNNMNKQILKILSIPKVQEEIVKAMGVWQVGDWYWCEQYQNIKPVIIADRGTHECDIRIPAFCDFGPDGQPTKRCLWGMVDWCKFDFHMDEHIATVRIERLMYWESIYIGDNPYLAVLKALCAQWGIKL